MQIDVFRNGMCGDGCVSKSLADVQSQSDPDSAFKSEAFSETFLSCACSDIVMAKNRGSDFIYVLSRVL